MKEEFILPLTWSIKATTQEEAKVICEYANSLIRGKGPQLWNPSDALAYYLKIVDEKYSDGELTPTTKVLTFEQFCNYVLKKPELQQDYQIYN